MQNQSNARTYILLGFQGLLVASRTAVKAIACIAVLQSLVSQRSRQPANNNFKQRWALNSTGRGSNQRGRQRCVQRKVCVPSFPHPPSRSAFRMALGLEADGSVVARRATHILVQYVCDTYIDEWRAKLGGLIPDTGGAKKRM